MSFTSPFNNTQTSKFKPQLSFVFYAAINHNYCNKQQTDKMDPNSPIELQVTNMTYLTLACIFGGMYHFKEGFIGRKEEF